MLTENKLRKMSSMIIDFLSIHTNMYCFESDQFVLNERLVERESAMYMGHPTV